MAHGPRRAMAAMLLVEGGNRHEDRVRARLPDKASLCTNDCLSKGEKKDFWSRTRFARAGLRTVHSCTSINLISGLGITARRRIDQKISSANGGTVMFQMRSLDGSDEASDPPQAQASTDGRARAGKRLAVVKSQEVGKIQRASRGRASEFQVESPEEGAFPDS